MRRLINIIKYDVRLKSKLIFSYLVLIFVPLMVLGIILYSLYLPTYIDQASEFSSLLMQQINKNIDSYFQDIDDMSINLAYDDSVNMILDKLKYHSETYDETDEQKIVDSLYQYLLSKDGVHSIHIYTSDRYFHAYKSGTINKYFSPEKQKYYERVHTTYGESYILSRYDNQFQENFFSISIVRPILSLYSFQPIGFLVVNVSHDVFKELIDDVDFKSGTRMLVLNENDHVLYNEDDTIIGKRLTEDLYYNQKQIDGLTYVYDENDNRYLYMAQRSELTSQQTVVLVPYTHLTEAVNESSRLIIFAGVVIFLISFVIGILITRTITKPLKQLTNTFNYVGVSSYRIKDRAEGKNEISKLWSGFNKMVVRIDELLKETIRKEDEKRWAEIKALQMQINPHFLYNTLNSIKYLSIIQNAHNITKMTNLLISLLKEIANNKTDYISIGDEINMLNKYIEIQRVIYMDKFELSIFCPETLYDKKIIKFILQPLVENSIFHGIVPSYKKGAIRVKFRNVDGNILIRVIDNGLGLESKDWPQESINYKSGNHIGLENIHNRIKLFYGEKYGIDIKGKKGVGTIVSIILPDRGEE